ncbi:unnamed protein product [Psylliodes chrysocephalus]|uniref:Cytochrome P450 n=1 Tax=Psylliodes chrysocephalus TaxID=3402493 RepID=A0A9P0GD14_9CUCU|nr:unnamed protein product [Psylliodes chrysocephala]
MIGTITIIFCAVPLLVIILIIVLHKKFVKRQSKYLKHVPGPKPNPLFGNMLDFAVPSHQFANVLENYINQYGMIFQLFAGPLSSALIISDEKLIEYVLSSTKTIEKTDHYKYFHNWLGTGLFTSKGAKWKERRRMLTPAFHFSILDHFLEVFNSVSYIFIKQLEKHEDEDSFDIYPLVSLYTLDVICEAAMGTSVNAQTGSNSKYVQSVKTVCAILTERNFSPLHTCLYPLTLNFYRERSAVRVLHSHTDAVIDRKIEQMKKYDEKNEELNDSGTKKRLAFLDLLLKSNIDGVPLTREDIREEVDTFMFAGHDTVASAISFTIYNLANNHRVQQKAFKEQIEIFGSNKKEARSTTEDLQKMKYLELVIKETLRLYPPAPLFTRKVTEDFEWENSTIPKDQYLVIVPYMTQRNAEYYPKPLEFIPERFLEIDGTNPYRYIPFSAGPRNCIGQKFAMLEMKSTLSKVLRSFELLPSNPHQELKLAPEIILVSKSGINISLKKRK